MTQKRFVTWLSVHRKYIALVAVGLLLTASILVFVFSGASRDILRLAMGKLGIENPYETSVSINDTEDDPSQPPDKESDYSEPSSAGNTTASDSSLATREEPTDTSASDTLAPSTEQPTSADPTTASSSTAMTTKKPTTPTSPTTKSSSATTTTTASTVATSVNMGDFSGSFDSAKAEAVLSMVNEARANLEVPLPALTWSTTLVTSANLRAPEIVVLWSHDRPDGSKWHTAFSSNPGYIGENIAYGYSSAQGVFDGWMASEGHRKNILKPEFTKMGISCYYCNGVYYWVQHFSS